MDDRCECVSVGELRGVADLCVCTHTLRTSAYSSICVLVSLTFSLVSNLCVCVCGGVEGPTGDGDGPPLPEPGCLGLAWIPLGLA